MINNRLLILINCKEKLLKNSNNAHTHTHTHTHTQIQERKQKPSHIPPPKNKCHRGYRNAIPEMG